MQFIIDESTGAAVTQALRSVGHDVLSVAESMPQATDSDILAKATREKRIVVTNDKDFGDLVFRSGQAHHGVLLLRLQDESPNNRIRVINLVLDRHADRLQGNFVVATEKRIRIRAMG